MSNWFQTWSRREYQEWATPIPDGYRLLIIRKEKDRYLYVKAKLIMGERGLPRLEVVEQHSSSTKQGVIKQIQIWKKASRL